jgi:CPA2 family monovalent cation:H+ antiporter-2
MSHEQQFIYQLTAAVCVALCGGLLAYRLKMAPIIGYLFGGMAIGPFTPGFVANRESIAELAEVGVLFLMFALGIEFSLKELSRVRNAAVFGTLTQMGLVIGAGALAGWALGWPWTRGVFFGGVIAVSSTMVILKILLDRGEVESPHGRLMLGSLIVQDLAVVVLILLLPRLTQDASQGSEVLLRDTAWVLVKSALFIGATLLLGAKVIPRLMAHIEALRSPELFVLTAVVLALGSASASAWLGLSPALGAFLAGLMLTETEFDHRVVTEMVPMRDIFASLFFVSVGMLIDVSFVVANFWSVLGLGLFIIAVKVAATALAMLFFRVGAKTWAFTSLGMMPIGEFNYVLAQAGRRSGALSPDLYNLILSSSLLTIVLTPFAFYFAPRLSRPLARRWNRLFAPRIEVSEVPQELQSHAVVVGYGRVGRRMARGLRQAGMEVVIIDQELANVRELLGQNRRALYGDASQEAILSMARPESARVIVVALPDFGATRAVVHRARKLNPEVVIIARAQRATDDARLREAGATAVVVPEIAGALMMVEETLLHLGIAPGTVFTGLAAVAPTPAPSSER